MVNRVPVGKVKQKFSLIPYQRMYLSSQKPMEVLKSGPIFQINFEGLRLKLSRIAPGEKETGIKTCTPPPHESIIPQVFLPVYTGTLRIIIIKHTHIRAFLFEGIYTNILHFRI